MKRLLLTLLCLATFICVNAKDEKTVVLTTQPQMHCANCEKKIKGNLRFEKGVKKIETNIPEQRVIITYDADKTTPQQLIMSFQRFGYTATEVKPDNQTTKQSDDKTIRHLDD